MHIFFLIAGVYIRTSKKWVFAHALRMIGWGVENGTKYWLVANSFNEDWGDKGLFKIRRGTNECYIEQFVYGGIPKWIYLEIWLTNVIHLTFVWKCIHKINLANEEVFFIDNGISCSGLSRTRSSSQICI